ncbi:hypothetical protein BJ742DRAFT_830588 [Cladochytrium replicatum]|nr:hypothetical protein BJ742DRAFT_830588 [Cladochytrium replicatum]
MAVEANDLAAGRIIYLISAVIAVAALGISLYTFSSIVKEKIYSERKDNSLSGKLFRSCVLLLAMCIMSAEAVAVTLELWLSETGELHAWSVLLRLVALSWRLNLIALASCFRFSVLLTRYKMLWEVISVVVLISNCVGLNIWRVEDFLSALKKNPSLDFDSFKEPALSSILAGLIPFLMYVYGSSVIFLPPLLRSRPPNAQAESRVEIGMTSLRVTEVAFTGINWLLLTTFLAVTFIPMGALTQKSVVTLVVHVAAAFECFYVYLVRAITGVRSLYDKVSGGSSKLGSSAGGDDGGFGKIGDSRQPPLPSIPPRTTSHQWEAEMSVHGSPYSGQAFASREVVRPPMPQQFVYQPVEYDAYGGTRVGTQFGASVESLHAGLSPYRPGTTSYGSQVDMLSTGYQGTYGRPGATYSSRSYGRETQIN